MEKEAAYLQDRIKWCRDHRLLLESGQYSQLEYDWLYVALIALEQEVFLKVESWLDDYFCEQIEKRFFPHKCKNNVDERLNELERLISLEFELSPTLKEKFDQQRLAHIYSDSVESLSEQFNDDFSKVPPTPDWLKLSWFVPKCGDDYLQ
jgi:hypothetical protein